MIGNDVVDLELAAVQSNWKRKGFLEKVFTAAERGMIACNEDRDLMVWLLWSMKEAAYKAHQRRFSLPRQVNWQSQKCTVLKLLNASAEGFVMIDGRRYRTSTEFTSKSLHTIAVKGSGQSFRKGFFQLHCTDPRVLFLRQISEEKCLDLQEVSIEKNTNGVPFVSYKGRWLSLPFSLSAHGKYSGFCLPLMKS